MLTSDSPLPRLSTDVTLKAASSVLQSAPPLAITSVKCLSKRRLSLACAGTSKLKRRLTGPICVSAASSEP